uniref:Uncharacterized protein n=1 Tax=Candidatus Kentrum sp. FW TaxID=2126338 RepID=A0A450S543_9GAMM|nr:MAG: hypothetical protein BECKFW1821A_GA0114235_101434 [Candidatus Kentron sp. FW]
MFGWSMVSIGLVEAFRCSWDRRVVLGIFRVFTYFCRVQLGDPGLPKANRYRTEQPCIKGLRQGWASLNILVSITMKQQVLFHSPGCRNLLHDR